MILALLLTVLSNDAAILRAVNYIGEAERALVATVGNDAALKHVVLASRYLDKCRFIRLGVNPENEGDPNRNAWWDTLSQDQKEAYGWQFCDFAIYGLSNAKDATRKSARGTRDRWLAPAMEELLRLDRTVAINTLPDTVFGPHGHRGSYRALLASLIYLRDHAELLMLEDYERGFNTGWDQYIVISGALHFAAAYWSGTRGEELGLVCRVMEGFRYSEVVAPEAYHALMGYSRLSDSWLNSNRANWRVFEIVGRCQ